MSGIEYTENEDLIYKKKRTKLRKIKKGLRFTVQAGSKSHVMYLTNKGHLVMAHHSNTELNNEMMLDWLSNREDKNLVCRCTHIFEQWRNRDSPKSASPYPMTAEGYRPYGDYRKAYRIWRRRIKDSIYQNKHIPYLQLQDGKWPLGKEKVEELLKLEFQRYGLTLYKEQKSKYVAHKLTYYSVDRIKLGGQLGKTRHSNFVIDLNIEKGNVKFSVGNISSLSWSRSLTVDNFYMVAYLIGASLFAREYHYKLTYSKNSDSSLRLRIGSGTGIPNDGVIGDYKITVQKYDLNSIDLSYVGTGDSYGIPFIFDKLVNTLRKLEAYKIEREQRWPKPN
jgi:hypothetical protein